MFRRTASFLALTALLLPACKGDDAKDEGGDEPVVPHDEFPGLSAAVEIAIDDRGIPHIYGEKDDDVAFASGYQMASDRLFQMDLMLRRALGRQAEVLGEDYVDQDIVSRTFDLRRWGSMNMVRAREEAPDVYNMMVSWLAGVNQRIAEVNAGDAPMPAGFTELGYVPETWELEDEFAIAKLLYLGNSNSLERDLLATILYRNIPETWNSFLLAQPMFPVAIMPDDEIPTANKPNSRPSALHRAPKPVAMDPWSPAAIGDAIGKLRHAFGHVGAIGSNNWIVDGRHTANGRPLIANDPHQPLQSPSLMYAQHLSSAEGGIEVAGFSFAGTAGVQLGHNDVLHWGATTNFADVMDLWEVRVEGEGVYIGDELVVWETRTETIEVAGAEPVVLELHDVPDYGVILPTQLIPLPVAPDGRELLANWTGFAATAEEECFMRMSQARTIDEWEAAVDIMEVSGFNFVAATAEGISYRVNIKVPDRDLSNGALPYLVIDGDDAASYWTSFLPPEHLPRSRAATRGWLATANNDPWGFTFDGDVTNDPFYYGYFYAPGNRAKRLHDELGRLTGEGNVTVADMQALQTDTHSPMSERLLPVIADAVGQIGTNPELAEFEGNADIAVLADALAGWDQRMERDSAAALIWHGWLHNMAWVTVQDDFAILYTLVFAEEPPFILKIPALALLGDYPSDGLVQETPEWITVEALRRTADWLTAEFGGVDPALYAWGDRHGTRFKNPYGGAYDGGWTPTDGGEDTVNVSSSNFYGNSAGDAAERFESEAGPIFRFVTTFAEDGTPEAVVNFPRGNSGEPGTAHWDDTLNDWVEDVYTPFPFRREEVEAATEQTIVLEPAGE
ncbi:penicillin acylase family protein [Nannocystaceae bacterium ST9]